MIFWLSTLTIAAAALFGGGTRAGFLGDVFVQLLAIPVLLAVGGQWAKEERSELWRLGRAEYPLQLAAITFGAMLVVQLLPLPGGIWADWLAARPAQVTTHGMDGAAAWCGLSLTPAASWAAAMSLLPPLAVFFGVSRLHDVQRLKLVGLVIALGALGLLIGFLQVAQGPESGLRFYEFTNPSEAVGFFANRNHFAAYLYAVLVFAAVWFAGTAKGVVGLSALQTRAILWFVVAGLLLVSIIAGIALARSRAGVVLTCVAAACILAMLFADKRVSTSRGRTPPPRRRLVVAVLVLAILFAAQLGIHRVLTRFQTDPLDDLRTSLTPVTLQIAWQSLPFGTGLGSFPPVYATVERNADLFPGYANRAHNDWAEFLLEGGLLAAVVLLLFLWWFWTKTVSTWRLEQGASDERDTMLPRAASIVIVLLLLHSFVDYPLRTTAISVLFAFACALLVTPPPAPHVQLKTPSPRRSRARRAPDRRGPAEAWGTDRDWPDAWKPGA